MAQLGARVPGNDDRDLADVALFGYEIAPDGVPDAARRPARPTPTARSSRPASRDGHDHRGGPGPHPGQGGRASSTTSAYSGQGTPVGVARHVARRGRTPTGPTPVWATDVFQALVVRADAGTIRRGPGRPASTAPPTGPPTRSRLADAVDAIPGVEQQRSTFNQIIGVTVVIAVVVVALFFALLTVERTGAVRRAQGDRRHARGRCSPASCCRPSSSPRIAVARSAARSPWCSTWPIPPGGHPLHAGAGPGHQQRRCSSSSPPSSAAPSHCAGSCASTRPQPSGAPHEPHRHHHRHRHRPRRRHRTGAADGRGAQGLPRWATRRSSRSTTPTSPLRLGRDRRPARARRARARRRCARSPAACCSATDGRGRRRRPGHHRLQRQAAVDVPPGDRRLRVPGRQPGAVPHRAGEPAGGRRARPAHGRRRRGTGPTSCSRSSAWPTGPRTCRASSPAASASGWRSAGRS